MDRTETRLFVSCGKHSMEAEAAAGLTKPGFEREVSKPRIGTQSSQNLDSGKLYVRTLGSNSFSFEFQLQVQLQFKKFFGVEFNLEFNLKLEPRVRRENFDVRTLGFEAHKLQLRFQNPGLSSEPRVQTPPKNLCYTSQEPFGGPAAPRSESPADRPPWALPIQAS